MNGLKKTFFVLFLLCICFSTTVVLADNGKLKIETERIQEEKAKEKQQASIGYELVPDLFLGKKSEQNKKLNEEEKELSKVANERNFQQEKNLHQPLDTNKVEKELFTSKKEMNEALNGKSESLSSTTKEEKPEWLWWTFGSIVIIFMSILGVLLGKKYAKIYQKK